jgi:hypothetical protein
MPSLPELLSQRDMLQPCKQFEIAFIALAGMAAHLSRFGTLPFEKCFQVKFQS